MVFNVSHHAPSPPRRYLQRTKLSPAHSLHSSNDEQSLEQQPTSPETIGTSSHEKSVGVVFGSVDVEDDVEDVVDDGDLRVVPAELAVVAISVVDINGIVVVVDGGVGVVAADVGDVAIDVVNGNNVVVVAGITVANGGGCCSCR